MPAPRRTTRQTPVRLRPPNRRLLLPGDRWGRRVPLARERADGLRRVRRGDRGGPDCAPIDRRHGHRRRPLQRPPPPPRPVRPRRHAIERTVGWRAEWRALVCDPGEPPPRAVGAADPTPRRAEPGPTAAT